MAFKVFTNGSVLQASEVNDNLMRQAVSTFSNAAARTAAITAPSEGMLTYLEDVDRYEWWSGSAWRSPFGMTLITSVDFAAASAINLNNVFSSSYRNYKIVFNSSSTSGGATLSMKMRAGGADSSAGYFKAGFVFYSSTSVFDYNRVQNGSSANLSYNIDTMGGEMTLFSPAQARNTQVNYQFAGGFGANYCHEAASITHGVATAYDGISFIYSSGNITGNVKVYGLRD